jgi:FtsP/CotA-like multicopper oxidase with cupredoxin domain
VTHLTRRGLLAGSLPALGAGAALLHTGGAGAQHHGGHAAAATTAAPPDDVARAHAAGHSGHANFAGGRGVDHERNGFDPADIVRDFDWGRTRRTASGRVIREWELIAVDKEIEVAPGIRFAAWTYNGRIPGPTLRAREGERLRIKFINASAHPHTIHFHGIHPAEQDGVPGIGAGQIDPGGQTVYEFDALPAGLHLYHCHIRPLAEHIAKGLYGAFIIDPADQREEADELVMVMNGFDTNFDRANELYAVNTIGFAYMDHPVQVRQGDLMRAYIVNVLEYDLINSFHLHGNLFDWYPTGTSRRSGEFTDTVMMCQGMRGIAEWRFAHPGRYMFHAHQSEFTELGWQGFFEVSGS